MFGDGRQTRDFVYNDDVADALVAAGRTPGISRSIINIGSGTEVSIVGLVDASERVLGERVHHLHSADEKVGVRRLVADVSLARERLGYVPRVSLEEGLRQTISRDPRFAQR